MTARTDAAEATDGVVFVSNSPSELLVFDERLSKPVWQELSNPSQHLAQRDQLTDLLDDQARADNIAAAFSSQSKPYHAAERTDADE
jgi:hypothetical protein